MISRGDLLRVLYFVAEPDRARIAGMLGFLGNVAASFHQQAATVSESAPIDGGLPIRSVALQATPESTTESDSDLIPVEAVYKERTPPSTPPSVFAPDELKAKQQTQVKKPPLIHWSRLWPYLRHALGCHRDSGRLDAKALTRQIANLCPIRRVNFLQRLAWAPRATILLDRRSSLIPFWDDMDYLVKRLDRWRPSGGLRVKTMPHGLPADLPSRQELIFNLHSMRGCPLLVLSDLGCLEKGNGQLVDGWVLVGHRVQQHRTRASALLPCPRNRWDTRLASIWRCSVWDRGQRPRGHGQRPVFRKGEVHGARGVDHLLDLLSPALFSDSILLRQLRLLLGADEANVGTEFDVWFHDSQVDRRGLAMALTPTAGIQRREKLALRPEPHPLINEVRKLLQDAHSYCSPSVRIKEILHLAQCRATITDEEVKQALADQQKLAETALQSVVNLSTSEVRHQGLVDYFRRDAQRTAADQMAVQPGLSIGYAVYYYFSGNSIEKLPPGIDHRLVQEALHRIVHDPGNDTRWELRQEGNIFRLCRWHPPRDRKDASGVQMGKPLALLCARRSIFIVAITNRKDEVMRYIIDLKEHQTEAQFEGIGAAKMVIGSDVESLTLRAENRPGWAKSYYKDNCGQFAEIEIHGVLFPMRWIPPGTFWMGSPENEQGRHSNEGPCHRVTIRQGFWMATTPCTLAQWKAVVGNHSGPAKNDKIPVNLVNWQECERLCARMDELVQGLKFVLPTEAEWEYACRAGTGSAFNNGLDCKNPNSKDPALDNLGWYGDRSAQGPRPVGELNSNAWGLYDMHGNVDEWCQDGLRIYTKEDHVDPRGPVNPETKRVLRGGSYWGDAGNCRSAYRYGRDPDAREEGIGFRLAAGQPGRSAALAQEIGAKGSSPAAGAGRGAKASGGPQRPSWAILRWEQDHWGRFAEFELDGAVFRFRWIAPGTFLMGSPESEQGRFGDEKQHSITLTRGFWLSDAPCTQKQWGAVMKDDLGQFRSHSLPVDSVSWNDCQEFCRHLAQQIPDLHPRLPTEAEWEYACRAGTATAFNDGSDCTQPEGDDISLGKLGWYSKNSNNTVHAVREKQSNSWGLYDMHGNVWEWCHDGQQLYPDHAACDPVGPTNPKAPRVLRGGSCAESAGNCRSAYRSKHDPDSRSHLNGFRLALGESASSAAPDPGQAQ